MLPDANCRCNRCSCMVTAPSMSTPRRRTCRSSPSRPLRRARVFPSSCSKSNLILSPCIFLWHGICVCTPLCRLEPSDIFAADCVSRGRRCIWPTSADPTLYVTYRADAFGVDLPRVAMLSYSTGASGSGAEVEKVALLRPHPVATSCMHCCSVNLANVASSFGARSLCWRQQNTIRIGRQGAIEAWQPRAPATNLVSGHVEDPGSCHEDPASSFCYALHLFR